MGRSIKHRSKRSSSIRKKRKKSRSSKRARKRSAVRPKTSIPRRLMPPRPRPNDELGLFRKNLTRTLYYCADNVLDTVASPFATFITKKYSVNGLFNPELGVGVPGEHQPRYFSEIMRNFERYKVVASKIQVIQKTGFAATTQFSADIALGVGLVKQYTEAAVDQLVSLSMHAALCERGIKPVVIHSVKNNEHVWNHKPVVLTASWTLKGSKRRVRNTGLGTVDLMDDAVWGAGVGANPLQPVGEDEQYDLMVSPSFQANASPKVEYSVMIAYKVFFFNQNDRNMV